MSLESEDEYDFLQKVIVVGDTAVGKTCLLLRFCEDEFTANFISTIGIDFQAKTFTVDNDRVRMQVWTCLVNVLSALSLGDAVHSLRRKLCRLSACVPHNVPSPFFW